MTVRDDGGPAFPADASTNVFSRGMTLRDYFAGLALEGILTNDLGCGDEHYYAQFAYKLAGAMLEARKS